MTPEQRLIPKDLLARDEIVLLYLKALRAETTSIRVRCFAEVASAVLMLGLWLALAGLSASERLHHFLHADAAHPEHDCLVVGFAKGSAIDAPVTTITAPVRLEFADFTRFASEIFPQRIDLRLVPGRAPPASVVLL